ncbi:hypothetical protein GCM10009839_91650 [Catenulispora yoronensis]|uniref:Protein kinase domain-containing protein n=2 Tax=Catenulispora yoronensis TaxID=450799 RepID=A0ABP5H5V2_9ACTN
MDDLRDDDPRRVGPYTLRHRLGSGSTGTGYLARSDVGRAVVLKLVRPGPAEDTGFRSRLRNEVAHARAMSWMSTTPVLNAEPDGEPPWVASAFVAGVPLTRAVAECGPLPEPVLVALARELAAALLIVHGAGLIHRGLAPAKVLLAPDRVHLLERSVAARARHGTASTADPAALPGSPAYLAPEQTQGRGLTPAADMFSLGSLLYFAAAGRAPFGEGPVAELPARIAKGTPVLGFLPPVPAELVGGCLVKDPNARATARQVLEFIDRRGPAPLPEGWLPPVLTAEIAAQAAASVQPA